MDVLWVADHLLLTTRAQRRVSFYESWTVLAALAQATSCVLLGPLVMCMPLREPALLAAMADTLVRVSEGRLVLGLGSGAERYQTNGSELAAFGAKRGQYVDRLREGTSIIHTLLQERALSFEGKHYRVSDCKLAPSESGLGAPPIVIGASGPKGLGIAARYADALNINIPITKLCELDPVRDRLRVACEAIGREYDSLTQNAYCFVSAEPDPRVPHDRPCIAEPPGVLARRLHDWHRSGIAHVQLVVSDGENFDRAFWPPLTSTGLAFVSEVLAELRQLEAVGVK